MDKKKRNSRPEGAERREIPRRLNDKRRETAGIKADQRQGSPRRTQTATGQEPLGGAEEVEVKSSLSGDTPGKDSGDDRRHDEDRRKASRRVDDARIGGIGEARSDRRRGPRRDLEQTVPGLPVRKDAGPAKSWD
ncbi:MAG: hypothetical protein OEZ59_01695 [Deltaproteobacteria bacterium]|nr:hypothetical protein [Deltaproteobacteria bacterium]